MSEWTEEDSAVYASIADVAVPRRAEMMAAIVSAVPFDRDAAFGIVELGSGDGRLAETMLDAFPNATLHALDGSESMRAAATERLARFGARAEVRAFELDTLDWWDAMAGAGIVVSSLCLHHLNDAKKQYVYKAAAERVSPRGALLIADLIEPMDPVARRASADAWDAAARAQAQSLGTPELFTRFEQAQWNHFRFPDPADRPSALLHHLVWLKHAGFAAVDCVWLFAGHAVFGGFKQAASASPPVS